jgi:ABC-type glutathione transport system ATPase component
LLQDWRREGISVLLATHDLEFAARVADRVVLLEEGKVADEGPAAETLFGHRELQTSLQRLTGRAWPASPADLPPVDRR